MCGAACDPGVVPSLAEGISASRFVAPALDYTVGVGKELDATCRFKLDEGAWSRRDFVVACPSVLATLGGRAAGGSGARKLYRCSQGDDVDMSSAQYFVNSLAVGLSQWLMFSRVSVRMVSLRGGGMLHVVGGWLFVSRGLWAAPPSNRAKVVDPNM